MEKNRSLLCVCLCVLACIFSAREISANEDNKLTEPTITLNLAKVQDSTVQRLSSSEAEKAIAQRAKEAILAIKTKNMAKLSALVHPVKGVRFSPYPNVDKSNLVFTRSQIKSLWMSKRAYLWGHYDGSGDPIRRRFSSYYREFVYDRDYMIAKQIGFNSEIMGQGTDLNNIYEFYPGAVVVEYHFPSSAKQEAQDWNSLWLVFEEKDKVYYLVGIAHGEWTI